MNGWEGSPVQFHRTSLRTEIELRRLVAELKQLQAELKRTPATAWPSFLSHPTWLALLGAMVTVATGVWQLHANRQLEREKLRSTLIQEASKSGSPETTLKNLKFLVKAGLVVDEQGAIATLQLDDAPSFVLPGLSPLSQAEIREEFGDLKLLPRPGEAGLTGLAEPDAAWVQANLEEVELPAMVGVKGFPSSGRIKFHRKAAPHLKAAIEEIAQKGLINRIRSFDGGWVPKTMRGSGMYSTHAFGIAIDINSSYQPLGRPPPGAGQEGSVAELVPIFERHGFFWGGRFARAEGGHFQYGLKSNGVKVPTSVSSQAAP